MNYEPSSLLTKCMYFIQIKYTCLAYDFNGRTDSVQHGFTRGTKVTRLGLHKVYKYWHNTPVLLSRRVCVSAPATITKLSYKISTNPLCMFIWG